MKEHKLTPPPEGAFLSNKSVFCNNGWRWEVFHSTISSSCRQFYPAQFLYCFSFLALPCISLLLNFNLMRIISKNNSGIGESPVCYKWIPFFLLVMQSCMLIKDFQKSSVDTILNVMTSAFFVCNGLWFVLTCLQWMQTYQCIFLCTGKSQKKHQWGIPKRIRKRNFIWGAKNEVFVSWEKDPGWEYSDAKY